MGIMSFFGKLFGSQPERSRFEALPGVTLYDNAMSPCARRVRMTLMEKGIPFHKVEVDIMKGDQFTEEYKKICPNKKVPAIAFDGMPGIEDSTMYESNVITELLDADVFGGPKLYPSDLWERAQVKMWQDWELGLVDDFVPYMYTNLIPFVLQLQFSTKEAFLASLPPTISPAKRDHWATVYDAGLLTNGELRQHAVRCYQHLLTLEQALHSKKYLVGNGFTTADLSVMPRVAMYNSVGLPISQSHFPNIVAYLRRLTGRSSIRNSEQMAVRVINRVMSSLSGLIVWLGNKRSGRKLVRLDGSLCLEEAVSNPPVWRHREQWQREVEKLQPGTVLLADYCVYPECWQVKLLLSEKGAKYTTLELPAEDVAGRWAGCDGIVRIHHNGHDVTGIRAVMDYLDASYVQDNTAPLLPADPLQRARVQSWQAWDCTLGYMELAPLLEISLVSKFVLNKYVGDLAGLYALSADPYYQNKFLTILHSFVCGVINSKSSEAVLEEVQQKYGELVTKASGAVQDVQHWHCLLQERLDYLDSQLQNQGEFLVQTELTLADVIVFCRLCFLEGCDQLDTAQRPALAQWLQRLTARPHFSQVRTQIMDVFSNTADL